MADDEAPPRQDDCASGPTDAIRSRRTVLRSVAAGGITLSAGCSTLSDLLGGTPGDVTVFNDTDASVTVTVDVRDLDESTTALSETADVEASGAVRFEDVYEGPRDYRFDVETAHGLAGTHEWALPSTDHYLSVTVRDGSLEFEEKQR